MKTFRVCGEVTVSCWIYVQAKDKLEAVKLARAAREKPVFFQLAGSGCEIGEAWDCGGGEADGVPERLRAEQDD